MMRQTAAALVFALCVISSNANKVNDWSGDTLVPGTATTGECAGDVFPDKMESKFASFEIEYKGNYKVLTNTKENQKYVLYQRGCTRPTTETGVDNYFEVPLTTVWSQSSTINNGLEYIGERKALRAVSGFYTSSYCIHKQAADGYTIDAFNVNYDTANNQWCTWVTNYTTWESKCDGINQAFQDLGVDGVFNWDYVGNSYTDRLPNEIRMSDTSEDTYLKVAEWNKYVAAFFNREKEIQDFDTNMRARWVCSAKAAEDIPAESRQKVLYLDHLWESTSGQYTPKFKIATCTADKAQYRYCEMLKAANTIVANEDVAGLLAKGYTVDANTGEVRGIEAADLVAWAPDVDVIIFAQTWCPVTNADDCTAAFDNILSSLAAIKAVEEKRIFDIGRIQDPFGGTAFFEGAHLEPDVLLEDVVKVTYPEVAPHHELVWLRNMHEEGHGNAHQCASHPDKEGCRPTAAQLAGLCVEEERHLLKNDGCPLDPDPSSAPRLLGSWMGPLLSIVAVTAALSRV